MQIVLLILGITAILVMLNMWVAATFVFSGDDHSEYDSAAYPLMSKSEESEEHKAAAQEIADALANPPAKGKKLLDEMRIQLDKKGLAAKISSQVRNAKLDDVPAEWLIAGKADPNRRLLYIHGGGYVMGSPKSHRAIASRLSELSNCAVLSIDYRLMPECKRKEGIEDCQTAYRWILDNGPDGAASVETLIVAGDSSGANLALATIAWARDEDLKPANAVVAMSPQTDLTWSSPSLKKNADSDVMQGKLIAPIAQAPKVISLWLTLAMHRMNPSNPQMSPLLGDLSNLPPTLLQASEVEVFLDDAVRYANKAKAHGSIAKLQVWPHTMHAWHAFDCPETDEACKEIETFLVKHAG